MLDEQVLDIQVGEEFAREVLARIPPGFLGVLLDGLEAKSRWFQATLSPEGLSLLDGPQARKLLRTIFGTRRRADALVQAVGIDSLRQLLSTLLYGRGQVEERFTEFCTLLDGACAQGEAIDLAGEALHYVLPERHWLWTRWMWNPRTQTGALRFVVADWHTLLAPTPGEVYQRVGEAVAYAEAARESLGIFTDVQTHASLFLPDAYLACVYTLYLFTALRMRMSKEFTKVLPDPWELIQRLLGIYPREGENAKARARQGGQDP
ncbi:MAG: hypothetical protein QN198_01700 [Armatimonadota bacterium]|nr:hypothetical protein [Armatimonadota bacterium]MDR5702300.1 hypothetical protein [Armatimonadota bacterium]MDR7435883.1 hypothetical protein [Armatimonadota bacterium]